MQVKAGCFRYCCNTLKTGTPVFTYKTELLERVKKAVPVLKGIPDDQIRISYKDVQLGTFVNIDSHEQLHLQETFRNAFFCGSDSYRRVHLKVRESDSPFLLKSSRSSQPLPQETEHTKPSVAKSKLEPKTLFTPSDDCHESELASTFNWKDSKKGQLIWQQQSLCDKKLAIETHLRELELPQAAQAQYVWVRASEVIWSNLVGIY